MVDEEEFQNYCLRIDLLNVEFECFWVLRVPDWLSLSEFHQCFLVVLDWPEETVCEFDFEDGVYRTSRLRGRDIRRTFLADAFGETESAFYNLHRELDSWSFMVRRVVICSDVSPSVSLLHSEEFPPPAACDSMEEYVALYNSGDVPRKMPAEETERRLQRLERNSTNWIGPYRSLGMTLHQAVVAALLERDNRPAWAEELEARLYWTDYESSIAPAAIRKVAKRPPLMIEPSGRLKLDTQSQGFSKFLQTMAQFRDPSDSVKLLVKRFTTHPMQPDGESPDVVLVMDSRSSEVQEVKLCSETDGLEPYLDAIQRARGKVPGAYALVVDQDNLDLALAGHLDLPVELRFSLEEMVEPFLALKHPAVEQHACRYPVQLSREELAAFSEAAREYLLMAPWSFVNEAEVFCIEGVASRPFFAVVLGYSFQIYGLSLFDDFGELLRLLRGDRPCSPYCFMDFPNTLDATNLRQRLDREQISYLSRDTCPYVYGNRTEAEPEHYRVVTRILEAISQRFSPLVGPSPGTFENEIEGVVVTWPIDLTYAI
ncbi:MAG: hypothetical protein WC314_21645 [Vulcanimicrobiota bacterium]